MTSSLRQALYPWLAADRADLQEVAACHMKGLANSSQQSRDAIMIIAAGAVPLLVTLLRSDKPALQSSAADASGALGRDFGSYQNRGAVAEAGVMPLLVALAKSDQSNV